MQNLEPANLNASDHVAYRLARELVRHIATLPHGRGLAVKAQRTCFESVIGRLLQRSEAFDSIEQHKAGVEQENAQ